MNFYTSARVVNDDIYVRDILNGERRNRIINNFRPSLYTLTENSDSEWRTIYGEPLHEHKPGSISRCQKFIWGAKKSNEDLEVMRAPSFENEFLSKNYGAEFDIQKINVYGIDIETTVGREFPKTSNPEESVLLSSFENFNTKEKQTFGTLPYDGDGNYTKCDDEVELLSALIDFWIEKDVDVITGWNIQFFDIAYLVGRMNRILGDKSANRLSPFDIIKKKYEATKYHDKDLCYEILGVSQVDYMRCYMKYQKDKRESYALDHIAEIELGEKKLVNPYDTFKEFYTKAPSLFVDYNIHDVTLVRMLEDKMKFIAAHLSLSHKARINYEDNFFPGRMWDGIIYDHLQQKKIMIPVKKAETGEEISYKGGYVKDSQIGLFKWIASIDLNSVYPHVIMQYNISPEMLSDYRMDDFTIDDLIDQTVDTSIVKEKNLTLTPNGHCYKRNGKGFIPELMENMYAERVTAKQKMIAAQKKLEETPDDEVLIKEAAQQDIYQYAIKLALVSVYGSIGNRYFRYFDTRLAESITQSTQLSIRWAIVKINNYLNEKLKTKDVDYVISSHTDSAYMWLEPFIDKYAKDFTDEKKIKFLENICKKAIVPYVQENFEALAKYTNSIENKMKMATELICKEGIWTANNRRAVRVCSTEGVLHRVPHIKNTGLETIRSSTPQMIKEMLANALDIVLSGNRNEFYKYGKKMRVEFNKLTPEQIGTTIAASDMKKFISKDNIYIKGVPWHVRGALLYNYYIKKMKLTNKYEEIINGQKVKVLYLKLPNQFRENVIAFPNTLPVEFNLHNKIDYDRQYEKVYLQPMKNVVEKIGWTVEKEASLDLLFG